MSLELRTGNRTPGSMRPLRMSPGFIGSADGSVLFELGQTRVLCTASVEDRVPRWKRGTGSGWVTAEYSLLPASTGERTAREAVRGKQGGRTVEIQRLIGRSLRAVVDMKALGERTVYVDCDVIEADGGTRCAAISGGYVALHLALRSLEERGALHVSPLTDSVAAIRVGVVHGMPVLDLEYGHSVNHTNTYRGNRIREGRNMQGTTLLQTSNCLLYTSPSPRDGLLSRMPSSA